MALQEASPLVYPWVDEQSIAAVLSDWTGIPSGKMLQDDIECVLNLEQRLGDHIFGQRNAIKEISQAIRIARAGMPVSGAATRDLPAGGVNRYGQNRNGQCTGRNLVWRCS
ncbi:hypothetical protein L325_0122095 [Yersinia pestis 9]|nr:hypothetical protein L325_0122095 [Yersinia pestis 9]